MMAYIPSPVHAIWQLGPVPVRAEALFAVAGVVLGIALAERRYQSGGGRPGVIMDVAVWAVPAGLIPVVIGSFVAPLHGGAWRDVGSWDAALGYPGAAALGTLAAWAACRRRAYLPGGRPRVPAGGRPDRVRFAEVLGAVAPALAFGHAVADVGEWAAQQSYGQPSSLWWAVEISPAHRLSGYENFATFQPMFVYGALGGVATGVIVLWASRRFELAGDRAFALGAGLYAAGGFAGFWLGIGHLPLVLGLRAGELGDAVVLCGAAAYLVRTRRRRTAPVHTAQTSPLERDASTM
jgi:prolipoprotein diacylglyceryltransferase